MKKYFLILFTFFLFHISNAQISTGISYSYNRTKLINISDKSSLSVKEYKPKFASNIHAIVTVRINEKTGFETGISFNNTKMYYEINVAPNAPGGVTGDFRNLTDIELHQLTIPLKYSIIKGNDNSYFMFSFGPQISYLYAASCSYKQTFAALNATENTNYISSTTDYNTKSSLMGYTFKDKFKPITLEFAVSMSVNLKMGLFFGYSYERSLHDIENHTKVDNMGRILNRFIDYSDSREGARATTILRRSYLSLGYRYVFAPKKVGVK